MAMKPDNATRKRVVTTLVVVGGLIGLVAAGGRISDWLASRQPVSMVSREEMREAERFSRMLGTLAEAVRMLGSRGSYADVIDLVGRACPKDEACPASMRRAAGEAYFRLDKASEARAELASMLSENRGPLENMDRLALAGNPEQYKAEVDTSLSGASVAQSSPLEANNIAWGACLLPVAGIDLEKAEQLARVAVEKSDDESKATYMNTLGVVLFRRGAYADAVKQLEASEKAASDPFNWPFLAASYAKLGRTAESREWSTRLDKYLLESFGQDTTNRHELLLFWDELRGTDE
jgi:tetratricopeptide (TPR) repeat protein